MKTNIVNVVFPITSTSGATCALLLASPDLNASELAALTEQTGDPPPMLTVAGVE